jgi:TPP-dependent pyruvate/acetoin dehydrogenase alpha subunit
MGWDRLSRIAAAVNPVAMHAETVDGSDPLAVADAVARKRALLAAGEGPALLDVECYRPGGHSTTDANAYRSREEIQAWAALDPIASFAAKLTEHGVVSPSAIEDMRVSVAATVRAVTAAAVDPAISPIVDVRADRGPDDAGARHQAAGDVGAGAPGRQEEPLWPRRRRRGALADALDHAARCAVRGDSASHDT